MMVSAAVITLVLVKVTRRPFEGSPRTRDIGQYPHRLTPNEGFVPSVDRSENMLFPLRQCPTSPKDSSITRTPGRR